MGESRQKKGRGVNRASSMVIGSFQIAFPSLALWSGEVLYGLFGPTSVFLLNLLGLVLELLGMGTGQQQAYSAQGYF